VHTKQVRTITRDVPRPPVMGRCDTEKHASEHQLWRTNGHSI
jgi:hypothetical protein